MSKKPRELRTVSYVHMGDKLVCTDDLTDKQRQTLSTRLKMTYLNALYQGRAEFFPADGKTEQTMSGDDHSLLE